MSTVILLGSRAGTGGGTPPSATRWAKMRFALIGGINGDRLSLDEFENGIEVQAGAEGLGDLRSEVLSQRSPGIHGSFPTGIDVGPRDVFLPLSLHSNGLEHLSAIKGALRSVSNPLAGMVRLETQVAARPIRWVDGYRIDGDPVWDRDTFGVQGRQKVGLLIHCPDPWARSAPVVKVWTLGTVYNWFPIFPLQLSDSEVLGAANAVFVPGDAPPYPLWEIGGPLTSVTATNIVSGRSWEMSEPLSGEQVMTISTDPRNTFVTVGGVSAWSALEPPFDLWPMELGTNSVQVVITGVTAATSVRMTVYPQWSSLL